MSFLPVVTLYYLQNIEIPSFILWVDPVIGFKRNYILLITHDNIKTLLDFFSQDIWDTYRRHRSPRRRESAGYTDDTLSLGFPIRILYISNGIQVHVLTIAFSVVYFDMQIIDVHLLPFTRSVSIHKQKMLWLLGIKGWSTFRIPKMYWVDINLGTRWWWWWWQ